MSASSRFLLYLLLLSFMPKSMRKVRTMNKYLIEDFKKLLRKSKLRLRKMTT